jgi:hypothetical protein
MKYVALLLLLVLSTSTFVLARKEGRRLVIGSVYRIVRDLIEVKEEGADITVIRVDSATTYINSSTEKPARLKDIAAGDQIVIKVVSKDGVDTAEQVKFVPALGNRNPGSKP